MSVISKVKSGNYLAERGGHGWMHGRGFGGWAVDNVERIGASYAFGSVNAYYRDKATIMGVTPDLAVGGALMLLSAIMNIFSRGSSRLAPHLERVGQAGLQAYAAGEGAKFGAAKAGRAVMVLPSGSKGKTVTAGLDILGMIPAAMGGSYLSADEIQNFAKRR